MRRSSCRANSAGACSSAPRWPGAGAGSALLFLDEPTAGLDPVSAGAFDDLVVQLKRSLNLTVVMVTHDLDSLWQATDRVAFLGEQRVIGYAPMRRRSSRPTP